VSPVVATHALGREAINRVTRERFRRHCRPQPKLTLSQWAERYRVLSAEATASHGPWRNDVAPYLVPIMDAISNRTTQEITIIAPSQSGKSEVILNGIGYFIHQEPSPILVVQPTVEMAEAFSKDRVSPMVRDSVVLAPLVGVARSRDSGNTILSKSFPGGQLDMTGANAPAGLAMRPKRVVFLDERDRHPRSAGTEGDVKAIAKARTRSYGRLRKLVEVTSPTSMEESLAWPSYLEGTQEVVQLVCAHCGAEQAPQFDQLKWAVNDAGQVVPDSVGYECVSCRVLIPQAVQRQVKRVLSVSKAITPRTPHKQSFKVHGIMAAFHDWVEIAQEFVTANGQQDPSMRAEMLRAFFNTTLGELYKDQTIETVKSALVARSKRYDGGEGEEAVRFQVPREGALLVAGVDIQHDRAEVVVRAFGVGETSWLVERAILRGDTSQPAFWQSLEEYRTRRTWRHESGAPLKIRAMAIDSGDGSHAKAVYNYCAPRLSEHVLAIKGASLAAPMTPQNGKFTRVKPGRLYMLGVHAIMERLYRRLGMTEPGPGYLHFNEFAAAAPPHGVPGDYFDQLLSMRRERDEKTRRYKYVATPNKRNEVADCEVYAYAAFLLGPVPGTMLAAEVDMVNEEGARLAAGVAVVEAVPTPEPARESWLGPARERGSWMRRRS
jgi:phage terminase large subunit GpA-like protein